MGGSGTPAKPSKLAVLAAARKKAQEEKKKASVEASGGTIESQTPVSLLEKLSIRPKNDGSHSPLSTTTAKQPEDLKRKLSTSLSGQSQPRAYSRSKTSDTTEVSTIEPQQPVKDEKPFAPPRNIRGLPSAFARTMLGADRTRVPVVTEDRFMTLPYSNLAAITDRDPFAGPSPDDLVLNAQTKGSK